LDPIVFWRHSLGCAMVCRKFSEKLGTEDGEKAYMAGLMHDIGFMVNCMVFPQEFGAAVKLAVEQQIPFAAAEFSTMGFTHCESGQALAELWNLSDEMAQVIGHHHDPEGSVPTRPLVALVHLSDLLCRVRDLGYGYYERQKVDLVEDPAWAILRQEYRTLDGVDLARFTFELDEAVESISQLVSTIFASSS
ncbi:MAG: HDOD domain-containing protein, partial [Candidatus Sulfotelmatobacter sp.]